MQEPELLFTELLNCDRTALYLNGNLRIDKDRLKQAARVLKRRITGEPIQYILEKTEFMGWEFKVNSDCFIPRPETEILVEAAIKYATRAVPSEAKPPRRGQEQKSTSISILDIGTGSGCIAVSLAKALPDVEIIATDISRKAIALARHNAQLNNVADKIKFLNADLFMSYELSAMDYDIILSNPPYIPLAEIKKLQPEISYEPSIALDGGLDGLDFYRKVSKHAPPYLKNGGYLIMEMGFGQKSSIENIFKRLEDLNILEVVKDYSNIDRIIIMRKKNG